MRPTREADSDDQRPHWPTSPLPDFGPPESAPEIPPALYAARLERLRARARERGYDRLVVYADREHSANLAFLTGFDPRFEEAVLVVGPDGEPAILVGNECYGMAGAAPLPMRRHLFQDLSLPSQPRDRSRPLGRDPRATRGSRPGSRVGVVGWKTYGDPQTIEAPAFLVDELRRLVGARRRRECDRPADRRRRRPAGHQRGRSARRPGVGRLPDVERRARGCCRARGPG